MPIGHPFVLFLIDALLSVTDKNNKKMMIALENRLIISRILLIVRDSNDLVNARSSQKRRTNELSILECFTVFVII